MLFLVAGILKPDVEDRLIELRDQFNEHLSQPNRRIALAGLLRDKDGHRKGYLAFLEAKDFAEAEKQLRRALKRFDKSAPAHMYLGVALMRLKASDPAAVQRNQSEAERELQQSRAHHRDRRGR